jgi:hypothetical protein
MDEKAIRRAALVTVRRGYSSDSRLGLRVERGCDGLSAPRRPLRLLSRSPLPSGRARSTEQSYRDAIYRRASRCKKQSDT